MDIIMIGSRLTIEHMQPHLMARHPGDIFHSFNDPALAIGYAQKHKELRVYVASCLGKSDPHMVIRLMRLVSPFSVFMIYHESGETVEVV